MSRYGHLSWLPFPQSRLSERGPVWPIDPATEVRAGRLQIDSPNRLRHALAQRFAHDKPAQVECTVRERLLRAGYRDRE